MAEQLHAEKSAEGLWALEKSGIGGGDGGAESTLKEQNSVKDKRVTKEKRADEGDEEPKPTEKGQSEGSEKPAQEPASKSSSAHNLQISEEMRPLTSETDAAPDKSPSKSRAATSKQVSESDASDRRAASRRRTRRASPSPVRHLRIE